MFLISLPPSVGCCDEGDLDSGGVEDFFDDIEDGEDIEDALEDLLDESECLEDFFDELLEDLDDY